MAWSFAAAVAMAAPNVEGAAAQVDSAAVVSVEAGGALAGGADALTTELATELADDSVRLVTDLLVANGAPAARAKPVAAAIMKYARLRSLDPLLIVGIIGVENATLVRRSRSRAGATGVMQVMPSWKRDIRDCGTDLHDVNVNVCFGTRILQIAISETKTLREALLRYNGCVRAPGCHTYASAVFSRAGRALLLARAGP
ncbi:MAG TPA: transglycosylase SLT domain-containing protein [Gemmatimonadaceae bacterium]|nr:transglycosylase SLT domain-containing protein [Gemmatimonadaceae bacterium]